VEQDLGSLRDHDGSDWTAPTKADAGSATGDDVLADAVRAGQESLGERLLAAYALGSLAHGGFSPLVSDVDLALILTDPVRPSDEAELLSMAKDVRSAGPRLHARLSVFWGTPDSLAGHAAGGRFPPLDRLCLLEHGRLLTGTDVRTGIPRPDRADLLVAGAEFALETLASDVLVQARRPELLLEAGIRWTTKIVLFPVRFLFTAETGREGTNDAAAAHYLARADAPGAAIVSAALGWRTDRPDPDHALAQLRTGLLPLYLHYLDDHASRLTSAGRPELAEAFRDWRTRLID
jgi:hypothetical protein